ncbi:GNAT family N-acetyltransferase [Sphingomonas sp.]|uniref:GNAT family N-acetyltransferase n=1 Tax=Sphingomonas sp. TaxID=28214 RepID=UPI003B00F88E
MIETERLRLRPWRDEDGPEFVRVTNTPAVMAHLGGVREPYDGRALVAEKQALQAEHGLCFWLVERRADGAVLGLCGLEPCDVGPVAGDVEIGWRLREDAWGQGYAREAALACLAWGWSHLDVPRIVAITVPANVASRGLMRRIGMTHRRELDFDHPFFPLGHPLRAHVGYAIDRA